MRAAVCHTFGEPLVVEDVRLELRGPARCGCASRRARSATATCPMPTAPGAAASQPCWDTRRAAWSRRPAPAPDPAPGPAGRGEPRAPLWRMRPLPAEEPRRCARPRSGSTSGRRSRAAVGGNVPPGPPLRGVRRGGGRPRFTGGARAASPPAASLSVLGCAVLTGFGAAERAGRVVPWPERGGDRCRRCGAERHPGRSHRRGGSCDRHRRQRAKLAVARAFGATAGCRRPAG